MYFYRTCVTSYNLGPCFNKHLILGKRFGLTTTSFKYLDVGISVGLVCIVVSTFWTTEAILFLCLTEHKNYSSSNRHWKSRATLAGILLEIHDLIAEVIKIQNKNIVKLISHDN